MRRPTSCGAATALVLAEPAKCGDGAPWQRIDVFESCARVGSRRQETRRRPAYTGQVTRTILRRHLAVWRGFFLN
jgi:hypothetical protein